MPEFEMPLLAADQVVYVRLKRVTAIPGQLEPNVTYTEKSFPLITFEKLEAMRYDKKIPVVWYHAGGFAECQVLSHPGHWTKEQLAEIRAEWDRKFPMKVVAGGVEERLASLEAENRKLKHAIKNKTTSNEKTY